MEMAKCRWRPRGLQNWVQARSVPLLLLKGPLPPELESLHELDLVHLDPSCQTQGLVLPVWKRIRLLGSLFQRSSGRALGRAGSRRGPVGSSRAPWRPSCSDEPSGVRGSLTWTPKPFLRGLIHSSRGRVPHERDIDRAASPRSAPTRAFLLLLRAGVTAQVLSTFVKTIESSASPWAGQVATSLGDPEST